MGSLSVKHRFNQELLTTYTQKEDIFLCFMNFIYKQSHCCFHQRPFNYSQVKTFWVKPGLHVTSALAFSFDLCRHVLENTNDKCEHHHLLL